MIYEVGHKVRVKDSLKVGKFYTGATFLEVMKKFKGKVLTIKEVIYESSYPSPFYFIEEDKNGFIWSHDMLESVDAPKDYCPEDLSVHGISKEEIEDSIKKSWDITEKGYDPEDTITAGQPLKFVDKFSGTEIGISVPITPTTSTTHPVPKYRKALVMFSGGFDSVALAVKVIESESFDEVTLLYEQVTVFDDHKEIAYNIFKELFKRYYSKGVNIIFETVDLDLDWVTNPGEDHFWGERDLCLMIHLTTIFGKGQYGSIFLGWNKSNITKLNYAKNFLTFLEKFRNDTTTIYFLEDKFLECDSEREMDMTWKAGVTKRRVVRLLLEHKLFAMCSAAGHLSPNFHWYDNSGKWKEVVNAIIDLDFTSKELSTVFKYKSLETVQKVWDKKNTPKRVRVTNKAEVVEEEFHELKEEQVVVEE